VEHPVTEAVTGIDLVREQFRVAAGENLSVRQEDIRPRGHALECRIYAEDPHDNFMPSIGRISQYRVPTGPGVRIDSGVVAGSEIPLYYDPIIAKMIVWGETRAQAIERTIRALEEYRVAGVHTTIGFAVAVMRNGAFQEGRYATDFIDREFPDRQFAGIRRETELKAALAAAVYDHTNRQKITISMKNDRKGTGGWITYHRARGVKRLKD
jgi:acetyl/propionyl-CoA carboxylase alpha subunit